MSCTCAEMRRPILCQCLCAREALSVCSFYVCARVCVVCVCMEEGVCVIKLSNSALVLLVVSSLELKEEEEAPK